MSKARQATNLSVEETETLDRVKKNGHLSVQLWRQGAFSESEFVQFGVLQRLVIRGHLSYLGWNGDPRNAAYRYAPRAAELFKVA